jgi:monovalent cation:H+ antiporter-2, CPA2 family
MPPELHLLLNVAIAVSIALVGGLLAHALRQPPIVGYLLAGIIIGPFTPGFSGDRDQIAALAEVGVIFLMFGLGIEFSLHQLGPVKGVALFGTTVQVGLTIAAGLGLGAVLGWPFGQGLFFSGVVAVSSTMVILKVLLDRGEARSAHGRVLVGMLIVQDLVVVVLSVLLPRLVASPESAAGDLLFTLARGGAFVGAVLVLGARVVPWLMRYVERLGSAELFLLTAVALALGTAAISAQLGLSPALGAFLGGLLLAETEFDHRVIAEIIPMRNLFATLFFVSIGMLIDPAFIVANVWGVLGLALFIVLAKALGTLVAVLPFRLGGRTAIYTAVGMIPIGEFSYVLAQGGREVGAVPDWLYSTILSSSVLTVLLTPAAFWAAPKLDRLLSGLPGTGGTFGAHPQMLLDDAPLDGHALVVGYGRVGHHVGEALRAAGLAVLAIDSDLRVVRGVAEAGTPAIYGDAAYPSVLAAGHPERARLIVVALPDPATTRTLIRHARRANATVPLLVRASGDDEELLTQLGATVAVAPERAGAELLTEEGLRLVGASSTVEPQPF